MRRLAVCTLLFLPVALVLLVPVQAPKSAARSPVEAAKLAEAQIVPLGLSWGRLRGWQRADGGWLLVWQPAHGAWTVRAWMPEDGRRSSWRISAASWLPGARLSSAAGALMLDWPDAAPVAEERLARRDWFLGPMRLLGALPAGRGHPAPSRSWPSPWDAMVLGLLLAGTVARVVFPALPVRLSRRTVSWLTVAVGLSLPWLTPVAAQAFQVGVRPWVAQVVVGAVVAMVLGTVIFSVVAFPAAYTRPMPSPLVLAFAVGLLAGRTAPPGWLPAIEGLTARLVPMLGIVVVGGWLVALAGDGLRQLLGGTVGTRRWLLAAMAVAAALLAGERSGPVFAVIAAASVDRPQGVWVAGFVLWGWLAGALAATCAWSTAVRDALTVLLAGVAVLAALVVMGSLRVDEAQTSPGE